MEINISQKKFIFNALSLYLIRGINMLFPLFLIPLIINTLGINKYGEYSIIISVVNILIVILDYGFNYTATKDIANLKNDEKSVSSYFSILLAIKLMLFLLTIVVLAILCFLPKFSSYKYYFLIVIPTLLGNALNPGWLFQGMQSSHFNAIINVFFRILTVTVLYLFLSEQNGLPFVLTIYSLGFLGWGIAGFILALKKYKITLVRVTLKDIRPHVNSATNLFIGTFISSLYLSGIPMFLNMFGLPLDNIGSYSVAERLVRGICSFISPLSIALLPHLEATTYKDQTSKIIKYFTIGLKISFPFLLLSLSLLFFIEDLVKVASFFNIILTPSTSILTNIKIQSMIIFLSVLNSIIGITAFVSLNYESVFKKIMLTVLSASSGLFLVLLNTSYPYVGSVTVLIVEILLSILLVLYLASKIKYLPRWKIN